MAGVLHPAPRNAGAVGASLRVFIVALERYSRVLKARRSVYQNEPTVENGVREFLMELNRDLCSPMCFGKSGFAVHYKGQKRSCFRCGEFTHEAKSCKNVRCFRCLRVGHAAKDCAAGRVCSACLKEGHVFSACRKSKQKGVVLGSAWEKSVREKQLLPSRIIV